MFRHFALAGLLSLFTLVSTGPLRGQEIGYVEDFALARDRAQALEQLIPGTEDYYYFHCLHYQHTEQFDQVDEMLKAWIKRHGDTHRVKEIQNRQALLTYAGNPAQSLVYLRQKLNLHFNHQRQLPGQKPNLPTALDQNLIARQTLLERVLERHQNLQGVEESALDWLIATDLNADRLRHLLTRLDRPDHSHLPRLIVDDLNHQYSRGFGSLEIHGKLLLAQLDELLTLKSDLRNQTAFVHTYLSKLRPSDDVDWRHNPAEYRAYLERLWAFVEKLDPVHNSLKAHVLYRWLVFDRSQGVYDKERFMQYIQLPRKVPYINPRYLQIEEHRRHPADLSADFTAVTLFPPIGGDESLVRSYLRHFFVKETTYKPYEPYINDVYLKHLFAETKIVNGLGEPEQWSSLLPPARFQALKERIDIDFAYTNHERFAPDEAVALDLHIKHVEKLIVKVYEINTFNYYRDKHREIDTDINLDGLIPNHETTHTYDESPFRRVRRHFEFPQLQQRGVYVIDFIGNGMSSRALIRKGRLHYLIRTGVAGHVFTVLDEQNRKLDDAAIQMGGHLYRADETGHVTVPFSTNPGRQPIVLKQGGFSSLAHFQHQAEDYRLIAGIFVDREQLLKRKTAQVVIRPSLEVNGTPVTLSVLEDVRLAIRSTDHDGIVSTQEIADFPLHEDRETVHEFQVPQRLSTIQFTLSARVKNLSRNEPAHLHTSQSFTVNQIDKTEKIEDVHLAKVNGQYLLELLGRNGEARPDRAVHLTIKHRDFRDPVNVTLETDPRGRIALGGLAEIDWVKAVSPAGVEQTWHLLDDAHTYQHEVHGAAGQPIVLPYMGEQNEPARSELSLLELRGSRFVADRFENLSIENGMLHVAGLPRGDYDLLFKESGERIRIRLAAGEQDLGYVLGESRNLEVRNPAPLQMERVQVGEQELTIQLRNSSKFARVHLFATRYRPPFNAYDILNAVRVPEPYRVPLSPPRSLYIEGRDIGDEYRYIIDRRYAEKYPGLMLKRPGLLLNPWAIRQTETDEQAPRPGGAFGGAGAAGATEPARTPPSETAPPSEPNDFSNLDFLGTVSAVELNLVPDENGVVTIPRAVLGNRQHVHLVAIDPQNTVYRTLALPEAAATLVDLRLAGGLDPEIHYTQQKQISFVPAGGQFVIGDVSTSRFKAYDSLPAAYRLMYTLSGNDTLAEFRFVADWHNLTLEEKREKYSKYACHELTFFILQRDPEFYRQAVRPYLANKKDRTFLDRWLLEVNLSEYLQPWQHGRLNIVEQILLARKIEGEHDATSRHVTDLFELKPPDADRFNRLFETAIQGAALDTEDAFGFKKAKEDSFVRTMHDVDTSGPLLSSSESVKSRVVPGEGKPGQESKLADEPASTFRDRQRAGKEMAGRDRNANGLRRRVGGIGGIGMRVIGKDGVLNGPLPARLSEEFLQDESKRRQSARQLYRKLEQTKEWVENNYYHLPIAQQNAGLITVNSFWRDFAKHQGEGPFQSTNLAEASRNFAEMMFALSLIDLPAEPGEHKTEVDGTKLTLTAGSPLLVYHEEILPAQEQAEPTPILASQNFFRHGDRYRYVDNERVDKYVRDEFLIHTVYGCQVVVTNPTSSARKLDVLLQLPEGTIPVLGSRYTRNARINLKPFHTQTLEYHFYFPAAGSYRHYPVQVAMNEKLIAHAEPVTFNVVDEPSELDRQSWDFVSQQGSGEEVIDYLKQHNLLRLDLDRIAFRMQDEPFFERVVALLTARHAYDQTLWSYGIKHNHVPAIQQYLRHADGFVAECGDYLVSPLLTIDPVERRIYQHMEYRPLVNPRAHQLGRTREIQNDQFHAQYHRFMKVLTYHPTLDDEQLLAVTYYMLLQDRIGEALAFYGRVNADNVHTRLQYDYLSACVDFYTGDTAAARVIATRHAEHPVDRWRKKFQAVLAQLDEIEGAEVQLVDTEERTEVQTSLAASQPAFNFQVESKQVKLSYQNLERVQVNYYLMDVELLFSRNPFVQQYSGRFAYIRPNAMQTVELPQDKSSIAFPLPEPLHGSNVLVEIVGGGQTRSQAYYSNSLNVQLLENYGQVRVTQAGTGKPVSTAYVKVYARLSDGRMQFYKDGYTDLRGRFDFTSLNTDKLKSVARFSLLVFSEDHGAVVREAEPPQR